MIWEGALKPRILPLVIMCFLVITYSLDRPNNNLHYPILVLKLSTMTSPTWFLSHDGYEIFFLNWTVQFPKPFYSIVTTSMPSISSTTQFNINEWNTWKWIFILFMKKLLMVRYVFFMFPSVIKLQTSSPNIFLWYFFKTLESVSVSVKLLFRLRGSNRQ